MKDYSNIINRKSKKEEIKKVNESEEVKKRDNQEDTKNDTPPDKKPIKAVVVNCTKLNVRKAPNKESKVLCIINKGDVVLIDQTPTDFDDVDASWAHVLLSNGLLGYVMGEFLKEV